MPEGAVHQDQSAASDDGVHVVLTGRGCVISPARGFTSATSAAPNIRPMTPFPRIARTLALSMAGTLALAATGFGVTSSSAAPTLPQKNPSSGSADETPDVVGLSVVETLELLETGSTTSEALVQRYLERIAAYDGTGESGGLRAIITVDKKAVQEARALDRERARGALRGPLHGVPIVVKDNYLTSDMPTTAGSSALSSYRSAEDATTVAKLREAGAIIIAKANMAEFAWHGTFTLSSARGRTANAFDAALSASGSSGGSAVALAASYSPVVLGTDSCGSIIGPSAHASAVGFRPTMGTVSVAGIVPLSVRQDVAGPIARTVADAALIAEVMSGRDPLDPLTASAQVSYAGEYTGALDPEALNGTRIGVLDWTDEQWAELNPKDYPGLGEMRSALEVAQAELVAQGATLVPITTGIKELQAMFPSGGWMDTRPALDDFFASNEAKVDPKLAKLTTPSKELTFSDIAAAGGSSLEQSVIDLWLSQEDVPNSAFLAAVEDQDAGKVKMDQWLAGLNLDAVAVPTSAMPANAEWAGTSFCDLGANTGVPSISVPMGVTEAGLPLGLELLAPRGKDAELLAMAYDYEQAAQAGVLPARLPELAAGQ